MRAADNKLGKGTVFDYGRSRRLPNRCSFGQGRAAATGGSAMSIDEQTVRKIFAGLEHGDGDAFFGHVADDVDWTVMGTHPLAGRYASKDAFKAATFSKLAKVLPGGAQLKLTHAFVSGDTAIVELVSAATARNGMRFDNHYCWVVRFDGGVIVEVRAYLDSALVAELFRQNPI